MPGLEGVLPGRKSWLGCRCVEVAVSTGLDVTGPRSSTLPEAIHNGYGYFSRFRMRTARFSLRATPRKSLVCLMCNWLLNGLRAGGGRSEALASAIEMAHCVLVGAKDTTEAGFLRFSYLEWSAWESRLTRVILWEYTGSKRAARFLVPTTPRSKSGVDRPNTRRTQ